MRDTIELDGFDYKILAALQSDAAMTNQQIGEQVCLSASQVSRRRQRLEASGVVRRYRAELDSAKLGLGVTAFVSVTLSHHSPENAEVFRQLVSRTPAVQAAYTMTGDMDYLLQVCASDLKGLGKLINEQLLPNTGVQSVRSAIALEVLKDDMELPLAGVYPRARGGK
ncbi:Lrp/AsnC family transcriptional regulator [Polycladidibacter hongkongensis]|uniref:Lrp/AsnC family transcriptional regulator n=1 Tax=Polycladidibacter hongkongensis TaxID=1647556 RepID=UPI000831DF83|nr:Lrp/AsnC family transcriptional regulator [Pseudovibrio hongkongensis]